MTGSRLWWRSSTEQTGWLLCEPEFIFFLPKAGNMKVFLQSNNMKSQGASLHDNVHQTSFGSVEQHLSRCLLLWPEWMNLSPAAAARCTLSDDSMGEQVRSQPIVTNRSEMSRGTSNCVKTLTLLFTKLHLEPYQSQTEVCLQHTRLRRDYRSQKKEERGKQAIL